MKYSRFTYELLLAISFEIIDISIDIFETGYLMGKKPEYRWNYPKFQGMEKTKIHQKLSSLTIQGLIEKVEDKYYLTQRGKAKFLELDIYFSLNLSKNVPWKGTWYLIMFDIPQQYKSERERLRNILTSSGLLRVQKSVYVYPHNLEKEFQYIRSLFPKRYLILLETKSEIITELVYSKFKENKVIN